MTLRWIITEDGIERFCDESEIVSRFGFRVVSDAISALSHTYSPLFSRDFGDVHVVCSRCHVELIEIVWDSSVPCVRC